ncbi:MAG: hypothetical protein K0S34_1702 [Bacillales bacterium]|jgi:hypothetical protein|nr:hypothetical protein [Bacillales bacterium]
MKINKIFVVICIFLVVGGCNQKQISNLKNAHSILEISTRKENDLKKIQAELIVLIDQENATYTNILEKGKYDLRNINVELDKAIKTNNIMLQKIESMVKIMNSSRAEWVNLNKVVNKSKNKQERELLVNIISVLEERERIFFELVNEQKLIIESNIELYNSFKKTKVDFRVVESEITSLNKKMDVLDTLNTKYIIRTKDLNNLKQIVYEIIVFDNKK